MSKVRNIREFTVAVSQKLIQNNWKFISSYSRLKGMSLLLNTKLQGYTVEINIIPEDPMSMTCFMCQFILNNRIYKVEKYDIETEIDDYLNKILSLLENLRDMETKVTFN